MSKDLWIIEVELAEQEFCNGQITEEQFESRMIRLGFNAVEVEMMVSTLEEEGALQHAASA
ncbi:hypothetical protein UFOVP1672_55 [uncultured Caudovirales phage]|uniref:Uncharacterized protein n=1 Tax=uncultured Caudovirales phage TaxID=2100421 RepID=A0A6J5QB90_9CAUD|nr:hypothetical protein UFOVP988_77 [uncultured Caudovirales phage]CAB4211084.1 hypothetical protein UFOVP1425_77 [uncultured Caudovirales phage]CAB4223449.1 hypothetical protein UFOVP1672_55 [uncultured Caudovirales phage]